MDKKRVVGIITPADWFDPAYSLSSVIIDQLQTLVSHGEQVVLFTLTNFNTPPNSLLVPDGVEIRPIVPKFNLVDYAATSLIPPDFYEQVALIVKALKENTRDITHCFAHDLIFQGWFLPYATALHQLSEDSKTRFFHWVHSFPSARPFKTVPPHTSLFTLPIGSKLVYLNHHDTIALAEAYSTILGNVVVVPNSYDPLSAWNPHPLTSQIVKDCVLLVAD